MTAAEKENSDSWRETEARTEFFVFKIVNKLPRYSGTYFRIHLIFLFCLIFDILYIVVVIKIFQCFTNGFLFFIYFQKLQLLTRGKLENKIPFVPQIFLRKPIFFSYSHQGSIRYIISNTVSNKLVYTCW